MTVTLIGWKVGGVIGAAIATLAIAWPSSIMIYFLQRSILRMRDIQKRQMIQAAAGALAVGLVLSAAWGIALQINNSTAAYLLTFGTIAITMLTRWHPLYLIVIGGALGVLGFI